MHEDDHVNISDMLGKTIFAADGWEEGGDIGICCPSFETTDGVLYDFCHYQECCETVVLVDVVGDVEDLVGAPLLIAEERSGGSTDGYDPPQGDTTQLWTFYELATIKGSVTLRFCGSSNGYYGVEVRIRRYVDAPFV